MQPSRKNLMHDARRRDWKPWLRIAAIAALVLVVVGLVVACFPDDAFARAGGGGGYTGGRGGGGGGFGGGGGGGDGGALIHLLIWLCIRHPYIGIPLLIVAVVFFIYNAKRAEEGRRGSVIRRGTRALDERHQQAAANVLRAEDPGFQEDAFCDRVSQAFLQIQQAWSQQDLNQVRAFVSDGIYERFSLQFMEQRDFGYRPHVADVVIHQITLAQVAQDDAFEVATLRINASCVAYRVSLADGSYVSGNRNTERFVEFWSFLRRRGVKTEDKAGLIEGHCPNCGAKIALNQSSKCESCDSLLRSGQYDWVLSEITQECEWYGGTSDAVAGAGSYRQTSDPGFNVQQLEDRTSVVFWRKVMADRMGDVAPLAKMAEPEFCERYREQLAKGASPKGRRYIGDCAVGSVDARGVLAEEAHDTALVEVRWSGTRFLAANDGPPQRTNDSLATKTLFVFHRDKGVASDVARGVNSSHCPSCGAPESELTSHACDFCGEVLNDGRHDWVLHELLGMTNPEAQRLIQQARSQGGQAVTAAVVHDPWAAPAANGTPHGTELLIWAVKMALADNQLDDRERAMLQQVARHRHVGPDQLEMLIEAAARGELDAPQPANAEQGRQWLTAMADMSLSDGEVNQAEYQLLCQAGAQLNLSAHDIRLLLRQRRTQLYRAARRQLHGK